MKRFDVYTKNGCPWCEKAKQLILSKGWVYNERVIGVNATKDEIQHRVSALGLVVQINTVPQIFLLGDNSSDNYIGGFDQLNQQIVSGAI